MRPCDVCGGSGEAWKDIPCSEWDHGTSAVFGPNVSCTMVHGSQRPCGRCVDMPWLPWHLLDNETQADVVRGRFKPDPDSVRPYCSIHESMRGVYPDGPTPIGEREGTSCEASLLESEFGWGFASNKDCNWVWVARPQRLEVTDE
jgi:hypothetical protein